ncbi:MAG: hypothetical protein HQL37_02505 [Alphaproteobacteria bacterium]|nr:hypothetical protein [Alphaproteobacteria bacterium]
MAAITLAGAAEEILGKRLADRSAANILKGKFSADLDIPEKVVAQQYLNKAKNWLKHWNDSVDDEKICLELDEEAIQYITRAITNLAIYDESCPSEGPRFKEWLMKNRPTLWE